LQTYSFSTTLVKYAYTKFYENLANSLVADVRSEKDGWTDRQTDRVSKQGIPFFTAQNQKIGEANKTMTGAR